VSVVNKILMSVWKKEGGGNDNDSEGLVMRNPRLEQVIYITCSIQRGVLIPTSPTRSVAWSETQRYVKQKNVFALE